jgi:hypothetical protein
MLASKTEEPFVLKDDFLSCQWQIHAKIWYTVLRYAVKLELNVKGKEQRYNIEP